MPTLLGARKPAKRGKYHCPATPDLFLITGSLTSNPPPKRKEPRFAGIIESHGHVWSDDTRSNFVRYCEDAILPAARRRSNPVAKQRLETIANATAEAYRLFEHLGHLDAQLAKDLNAGEVPHASLLTQHQQDVAATRQHMAEQLRQALKALNQQKHHCYEDLAMLLEPIYMALRGSKSLVIIAHKRNPLYAEWGQKYPHLWMARKNEPPEEQLEDDDSSADLTELEIPPEIAASLHHSPRPIWWGDLHLGRFAKLCRELVPLPKPKAKGGKDQRSKRLHSPATLYYWRSRPQPSKPLPPGADYRT